MNYRDKIQKFSIRKYTVGTFSTVIATLVFLGFNTSQAHAAETNQPASVVKQKQQSNNEQTENRESQAQNSQNSQNGQSLSATRENEQPNISQANLVDQKVAQSSTTNDEQPASQNVNTKKDSATAATTQPDKEKSKHKQNESQSANKNGNDNRAAHVENHEANVVTASDSSDNGNVQHDRNELQAFFDANYHDYRFIDRENADSGTFNYVKGIFDKINTLLGSNDPINNKDLQLAYKELEQAVALIRTMPQRQQTSRRSSRIQTRSIESRAAEPRSVSSYQNADSSYYVENANDGSGYPVGTYINASNKGAPYYLPTAPWNTLKASAAKEIVLMTAKQTGDGYQWVIKFNKGHAPHDNMIFWFALPSDQVPVGRTDFVTVNADGTNVQWSNGAGAGAYKPLPEMWPYGVNDSRSRDFKIRNRSGQVIYDWADVHVNTLRDLARAGDYFSEANAPAATKALGEQTFKYINGERPTESPGASKVYTFIGAGDASYTISFRTQGPTTNKLYYTAGGRALEYNQLFMYSQLYVESTQDYQQRLNGFRQVINRTYRIGTTKRVEVSQGNVQTKKVLESTNLNIDDFVDDPLSYVKTPSNKVLGFYPSNANTNGFRPGGTNPLNEYQLSQLFTDDKLQQAARTGTPIRLMIGFDYPDGHGNSETLVPVNLTVLPEIQHNIKFFKNDDTQNIADKPFSKQAGHPVFYVYAGNQGNASVNLGGSVTSIQPLRINLTSNENFTDKDWQITGIPRTLHIENSTNRPNNARERNIELVGNLLPGDYFGTIRFGRKEQLFEIRVKPHTPRITTTAEELRGTALQKVPVTISGIPLDPSALVYLVTPTSQTTSGGSEADQIPSGYTKLATGTPDGVHTTITIRPQDYVVFIPPVGKEVRAVVFYNNVVASNMSNAVTILPDDIPPTINNPVGINAKYYRGDEVNFTMGVSDRHTGIKNTTITTLPNGWTSNLTKADKNNGSLSITGRVSMNQAFNSDITFKVSATDNANNTTNDSQSKHVSIHVGKISEDAHPIVLGNTEKVVVVNPTAVSNDEKQSIITAFMNKNQNIRGYLASTNPVTVDNNGNVTLHYRDGSSTTLDATNVMTYEPVVKPEYQTANAAKTATVTIAKGQSFSIGDIKQYFTLSNGQAIPSGTFTNITSDRTIPTAQEVSQMNAGTQLYHLVASNAYHKDTEDFYISLKIVDVKQPEGDQRVYRTSTYDLTTDEISKVKQAFINANRDVITLAEGDISVTNTPNGANVTTITVNINKGRLTKSFASNLANMNFLRWVNFPQDYTVTWTNAKIANRPTDGGLSWSDDHKSLIYRYDATLGTQITTNDILTMLKATTTVPGLRNNITGNEKAQAGGRPNYRTTGYSQANASSDGQRQYTLNGQVIQILDIINPSNGYGGQPVTNSNTRANHSNATVVNVNEPAANGAGAFTIDHVVKSNSTHNASDAVYKAQLYLTPYGPKQYVEHLNQNTGNTTDAINIYFVPSDLVNPTISVGNYTNHQVFSGETFTNTITANDNFGVQSVTVPTTSQITGTVDNNHQHVSATAPNVTSATSQIDNATTVADVTAAQNTANELNTAMGQLQNGINDQNTVKQQVNFTDADQGKKDAYTNAVTNAQGILDKAHGQNMTKAQVEAALNQVTTAKNALNGDANVRQAKSDAKANLGTLTHLNNAQKQDLTSQIEGATTVNGVNGVKTKAQDLDGAMQRLQSAIANKDQTKANENYIDADPTKKTAFDNAITQAESYLNKDHGANKDKQAVEQAIQSVTSTENALNGDANLQRAKTEATQAIDNLTHLNTPQKTALKQQVNAAQRVSGVTDLENSATSLNNAMDQLKQAIADHDTIVAGGNYTNASPDKQGAYTDAYNAAKNIVNGSPNVITNAADVTAATQRVNNAETGLNGDTNLATAKQQAKDALRQMTHLSDAQKQSITGQIDSATQVTGVQSVKDNATNLDNAMNQLRNSIANKDEVKASQPYVDADRDKQNAYNTAVTSAENIINATSQPTLDPSAVTQAANQVNTNKTALNGAQNLANKKQETTANINQLSHLNNAQKQDLNTQVTNAPNISTVNQVKTKAEQLDQAMERLINGIQDKDQVKQSVNFTDADPEKQTAYNNAVTAAENIINQANGTNANQSQVEAAMNQVNTTKAALNGTQNLEKAKQHANTAIDGLSHLTNAQKEALKQLVQQSTTVAEAQGNEQKANNVDAAMDKLRQSIADNATTKQNQNYTDSSPNKKDAYNNAVTTAQGIIDQTTSPTLDPTVINQAAGQVSTTKNALNGNENLEAAKQQATQSLGSLDNLNNAQKQAVTDQINGAHTVEEANQIKQNAQNLNTAMGNLKQAIADKDATKATVNFTDADQAKQQAYNTAVTNAENIISKANGGNATQSEVEQAIQQVNATKQALNGNANVQHAKDEATALINSSNDLNQAQKDALKQQVQNETTVAGVNNVKQTAQELNNAMTQLKQGIADKEQTKADGNFVNADPDKQNAYKQAVAKAEALISGTPDVVVTPSEISAALNKVTQAKNDLNGNTNLASAKQNVQHAIDQLPNLNQAQRDEYSKQITQATLVPNVNAIQQAATTLNDAMTQLKQGIANKAQIKGSENYHDADTDKQTAYDNAVTKAEELLKQTTNPTMDPNTIQQALTKVNDTNQALNGNQKLADAKQAAKTNLGTLDHLNDAQKQALTTQVEQAPDIATVNNVKQNAQNLNNAMTNLSNALQDKTETLNSINFTDADQAKKDAYTNAVAQAEGILSKANGNNASQTEVEQAMQRVNEAKQALNGNDNVQRAKDAAKQVITNANDLNQAQKDALKQQVDAAQTVANVNTIKQTAQDLNQAMTQLKQGIADKDQTKANGNFVNADTDKQNAYNNAVAHAEQIISGTPNANVDPQQVAQALQQVTQAKGDLNGNHNLQVAKDNANTAIDQLPNLNQPQKTALKDQVSHAELVTGVNAIKQNADALNNAMGTLKQQIQANSQVPQSVDFTQADQDKQQAYNNAANQAQQIANGTPTPVLTPDTVTQAVTTMNQAKDALNGDEKLAQAKQDAIANLDTLRDLNQPQRDALRNQINQAQALATVEQTKQNAQNVNTAMSNLKQGIANKDTVTASENYHDADADKQTAYTNAVSQAEGIINQTTNPTLNPDDITRALTQVTDAKNGLNGEAKLATEKQNAKDAVNAMTHLNDAQKQALKGQIDQSPEIARVTQVKQTATSLDQAMNQLSQAINDKTQTLTDGNYLNADPDKQNAYKQAVAKAEALLNKQSGTNEVQAQVESITNEVNAAKQALNGNDNLANAKQQAKQQLANLTHLNDAQKQSFESQITQAPLVTDVTTINQKAQTLDHAMELLRNSIADNQATLASEDYHDATAQRQNDYNQAVTAANNIINQTTSPTMNPDEVNSATTQVNNTKVALDGDENLVAAKQQANNRLDQLDHLNNAQKQQLQSQITQSSDIAAVNGHKQTAESLNTAMGNLINAIADHQAVEQRGNFINADTDKQTAYTTAVNEAEAMINKQTGQNANQPEVEQAITKVQTTLQALNGDHNLQVAKTNATQAIDALTSLNDPQKTALKDQVTAATLVTAVHQIEQNANTLNQAMHGLRESIQDNAATKANSKYINEDQPEQQNYDQAVQAANNIINEQTATLDNNVINQAATTVNTTKAALHGDVKLQNDKDHAKQTVSQLAHLNNAQKHMEDTLIDNETTRTAVKQDLTEAQALDQLMDALQQSIADKDATRASSAYVNAEPNKKQAYDEAVQNAESIIAGLNNPTINKGNVSSATQAVTTSKNGLDGVERLAQDKQTAGNSLNHLDQLTPAQQQALENQINNATTRDKVAEIIAQAQALNEAMKALKESIKDQPQTEASSKFINEDQAQKDAYTQAVQHAKDLINKTTDPTLAKSIIDQATQAVTDAKNNLHGDQKLAQDKQRATEMLNNLSNLNTPQRQALENQINNAATRGEVAQKLTEAQALNQAMEALRNSIQDQQQTEAGSKFINEDKPQKDAYQAAVQHAKDLINQTSNPTLDKAQVEQLTQGVNQAKDNLHGDQKLADDKQHAVTDLNQLNSLNNPQRQALESQINNAATRDEVAQKLAEAQALDQAMQALRNSIQDQQQTESGSKFINEDKPQKDAYQAAVQHAKDLINQTGNPTLDKSQVEQLTQAVTTAKDNLHGDQKLARDQQQAVTTVNALPNLNHAQQQALTDAINAAPTRTEVAQHVQTATELDHAMETLKNKVDQVNTDKAQPNYTEASTDKKEAVDQALQAAESITDPTNGSNANKDAVEQALTKLQEKVNELNGNERVAEAKTQAKQTIDQLTHLNAEQIATAKQNIDQATKLQPIAELVDQATQLNQSMDQLQQAVNEHANVEQTVDYTQADSDKQNAYKQAIAEAENVLKQNSNKQQVDQALQNILNVKQALNGDERVALAKTNGKHDIDQLNALNNAQQDGFKGRIDQSNDLNQIQQIVDEAKALNRAMDQLSQEITGNEGRTKGSTNYVNADTQVKQVYDEAVDKAKQALDKSTGQNLTAEQVIKLNDAVTAAKQALNGEERLNNRKSEALQRLDQLTHLNNAQRQLATQQINNAETLNKASRAINRATKLDNAMGAVQQYIDEQHLGVISSTNYINADDNLKANYDNAIANAAHELDKVQGNAIAKAEAEQLKQNIIDAQNALNGDQNLANAKDKANAFVNSLNGLNKQQQDLAHNAINNADTVSDVTDIVNNQIDLNNAMETLKHLVDNEIPNAEQTVNYQNADDNAKTNFDDAKRLANTLLNSDNTNVNDINGAIQSVNDAIQNLNGDQRLQDAKDKAIQSINQALANKLKEIEASNATDQDKLIAKNKAEELANNIINNINKATSNQDVSQVQTAGNQAIEQVHANEIPKAKIDANKDVDKQVQALIDEIDRNPNLTDKEKQALKDRINQMLQQGHNDINNALTKEEIEQAIAQLAQALQEIKDLVKAKEDAKQDVDKQVQALIDEIDRNPNLTDKEKQALKDRINQILQQGHNDINNAMTKEGIEQAKERLAQALQGIKDLVKAKEDTKQDVDKRVQALIDEIDRNPNLTDKEKQALKDRINQILQQGHNGINNAMTKEEIEQAKERLAQALQDIKDLVKAKEDAKNKIKALANAKRDQINSNPDLTPEQKAKALKEIDEAEKRALQNVENAQTIDQLNRGLNLGLDDIRNTHVWEVDDQPAVNEISEATPEQLLVNGELIVHRDDIITEQDVLAHINLIDQLTAEVIDTPSTATISDSLTAKVEVTLLDGSKVIVNVPVKVVEKELSVVKQQAIESIENEAQQKINEINNSVTLTLEQKEAAIAEVNKLKQQAIDHINNAPDVHSVEEIQQQEQAHIEQFNPEQFTIEQAKSNAIKSIEDAIQHMIDEIKARTDLTDKEKQEAIAKLNQLKEQAIQAIQRAQSIDEITGQLEQFKAQMKAANPIAKELAKRKQEAISRIKDFSNEKMNSIRNSEIGSSDEKQAAMNRINEIVLETIRDINNAHTLQQVEAALNNGIARISAVQIVTSDRAKQSSSTGNESNSHLTIGYGTANHPFNSSTIGHKKKLDEDDDIDPLHMRHFSNNFGNVIKNAIGVVGISGLLASFWFFIAKRRRKEDEEEELEIRDNNKDSIKETLDDTKHLPLLFAKRRRKEDEEDVTVEEKDSLNNGESLDKVKHTPFFLPKRRRKEDEEDVEVTNENTDEKVLKDNEHSPLLIAKRRKDKEENVETTTSIESKDEDVPLLLAKKKNQKDNQSKGEKSASKKPSKKVAAKKKKKKSKKNKK
ncbi:TPA: hyperosmolarity resistance protein Ebh [Staphylococcus aureus]|nr:hyperosmolarity resistance protein Ebh [Staphylococcus aureus]HEB2351574.1 hyperosmolarity resistance protein Ebh [Staphylococcus aureus]HEB2370517.1 hyperosmolarity resistance protein Ebh [Staphylococcus aureus]